jgi:SAM-dependent methyltransferase
MPPETNFLNKMSLTTDNINSSFFNGIYKDVWKKINNPGLTQAETEFILDVAMLTSGDKVLDLMCGYGRHSLLLGQNKICVTAVDNQPDYIAEINSETSIKNLPVKTVLADVLNYNPGEDFKAVICLGNSFAFFNEPDTKFLIDKIANCLQPGGIFLLNSWMIAEIAIRHFREKDWFYVGEYKYLLDYKFEFAPNRIESEQVIIGSDGFIETNKAIDYIFSLDDLNKMFKAVGMRIRDLYATPRKKKFKLGDSQIYIVVEKIINP